MSLGMAMGMTMTMAMAMEASAAEMGDTARRVPVAGARQETSSCGDAGASDRYYQRLPFAGVCLWPAAIGHGPANGETFSLYLTTKVR